MKSLLTVFVLGLAVTIARAAAPAVTTGVILDEMKDLAKLARWPSPGYQNVQFSSYDRRSTTPETPNWFGNADGFGEEPIPNFMKVLRPATKDKPALFLLADVRGPGAIVRGWSAGMDGVLRVYLDPKSDDVNATDGTLIYEGPAYGFLARRSAHYLKLAGVALDAKNAFIQQGSDYLPIPFASGLRVTWEGSTSDLHFYHLQVRKYPKGTAVRTFDAKKDMKEFEPQLRAAVEGLTQPTAGDGLARQSLGATIVPQAAFTWSAEGNGPSALRELSVRIAAGRLDEALRGCLLRISFDGAQRYQVESPLGDFFASGPGLNPFSSLPFTVTPDGTFICRFVMPYRQSVRIEIVNHTPAPVALQMQVATSPWKWDDNSMYFHAKWRIDPDLVAGMGAIDLPYVVAAGQGVFVGCAAMILNPVGVPTANGNWWGEGDEKFLVDGEKQPSIYGTGSEDYFNYSWSRWDLFADPYCGQPLDSGPDTAGYISNHRFQVIDAVPFEKSLAALMELWAHAPTLGVCYARISYYYAKPDVIDDHRALMPADLKIQPLPRRDLVAFRGSNGARCFNFDAIKLEATAGKVELTPMPLAFHLHVANWQAEKGAKLKFNLPFEKDGKFSLHVIAVHQPNGAVVHVSLDGKPLATDPATLALDGKPPVLDPKATDVPLRSAFAPRMLNVNFQSLDVKAGSHVVEIECVEPGPVGLDSLWVRPE